MSVVTLDFESPYGKGVREDHILYKYTLSTLTYEQYIRDPRFKVFGVGIKIDDNPTQYYSNETHPGSVEQALNEIFTPGNDHTLVAHNMLFDGAVFSWYYGLSAKTYWCTQAMSRTIWNQRSSSLKQLCISCYPNDESIRKGDELVQFENVYNLDPEQDAIMAGYCINDVDVTFECLKKLWQWMPDDELEGLDMTLKMHIHPAFVLDHERIRRFLDAYNKETDHIVEASGVPRHKLASPSKFVQWVQENLGLEIPLIPSPTKKNPDNMKYALGKDEIAFIHFQADHSQYQYIWDARLRVASTIDRTRAERMLSHGEISEANLEGRIATPLNFAAAHTLRWGGTNKINFQNLKRGSELRKSLKAPDGYQVIVADLSNIEGRMNAWFCQEQEMLNVFANDGDLYNDFATKVFRRPIDRKHVDENGNETMWMEGFVGKTCILGLGYQTGPAKLRSTLYIQSNKQVNFSLEQCKQIVYEDYRGKYTQIVKGWDDATFAIQQMLTLGPDETMPWRCLVVERGRIRLPNGLYLNYPKLKVEEDEQGRPQYLYWNGDFMTNLYGGKLIENIIQALSRCVMLEMMLKINRWLCANQSIFGSQARVVLTVHDEIIALGLTPHAQTIFTKMLEFMSVPPDWCNDGTLVLKAEGGFANEYSK